MATDIYTADVTARPGSVTSDDEKLKLELREAAGSQGGGTNPEQLMGAALASCLLESLKIAASSVGGSTDEAFVRARVTLSEADGPGFAAHYDLRVTLPDAGSDARGVLKQALSICPFTKTLDEASLSVQLD